MTIKELNTNFLIIEKSVVFCSSPDMYVLHCESTLALGNRYKAFIEYDSLAILKL